ncbi:hypothetical protein TSOC_000035 [Tetrabaena socialis]|uniref:RRM domain-containing protein n=1 Tax=Tetrabaena socialis TaxID=47790 RepID=A0A2J8AKE4_9CHLO|nr:hypothetical protein TSOC_000035 [Tetrabaena socialis]|eukprot:PNH12978.1 hypothetical protein TSOC_000035 [Tetrabaena socialis]
MPRQSGHAGAFGWTIVAVVVAMAAVPAGACKSCLSVFKAIGDLGASDANCTLLAELASEYFATDTGGGWALPDLVTFACSPSFTPTVIEVCVDADEGMVQALSAKFEMEDSSWIGLFFFIQFGIGIVDTCTYPRTDDPHNRKGVAFINYCDGTAADDLL